MTMKTVIVTGFLALAAFGVACGDDETSASGTATTASGGTTSGGQVGGCNEDPAQCGAGQTCWLTGSAAAAEFKCLNSGPGAVGEDCQPQIGTPTCGDGLTCWAVQGADQVCTQLCDNDNPALACPDDQVCVQIQLTVQGSTTTHIYYACEPPEGGTTTTTTTTTTATGTGGNGGSGGEGGANAGGASPATGAGGSGGAGGA